MTKITEIVDTAIQRNDSFRDQFCFTLNIKKEGARSAKQWWHEQVKTRSLSRNHQAKLIPFCMEPFWTLALDGWARFETSWSIDKHVNNNWTKSKLSCIFKSGHAAKYNDNWRLQFWECPQEGKENEHERDLVYSVNQDVNQDLCALQSLPSKRCPILLHLATVPEVWRLQIGFQALHAEGLG